jgi:hypothetical protein
MDRKTARTLLQSYAEMTAFVSLRGERERETSIPTVVRTLFGLLVQNSCERSYIAPLRGSAVVLPANVAVSLAKLASVMRSLPIDEGQEAF